MTFSFYTLGISFIYPGHILSHSVSLVLTLYCVSVLICSPTINAGHSIECHINKMFAFLFLKVLSHDDEHEMLKRVRPRADLEVPEVFIQRGILGRALANYQKQSSMFERDVSHTEMRGILSDVNAE